MAEFAARRPGIDIAHIRKIHHRGAYGVAGPERGLHRRSYEDATLRGRLTQASARAALAGTGR